MMTLHPWRIGLMAFAGSLLLAGCSHEPAHSDTAARTAAHPSTRSTAQDTHGARTRSTRSTHAPVTTANDADEGNEDAASLPTSTGIAACDDYLASYKGCHRAAGIYAPNQLEGRYQAMRTSLLRDSQDPDIRPQLANRCNSLASQLRQALHGRACEVEPASTRSASSSD